MGIMVKVWVSNVDDFIPTVWMGWSICRQPVETTVATEVWWSICRPIRPGCEFLRIWSNFDTTANMIGIRPSCGDS